MSKTSKRLLTSLQIEKFRTRVYDHYKVNRRDLPWRKKITPYRVFISEVMLQQTQVDRVVPKFLEFLARFPDWHALAEASLHEVLAVWQGLGYNRRARFLKSAAECIIQNFNGKLPESFKDLQSIPGIGPATAASISVFAFQKPLIFIETNIRSVFLYHFFSQQSGIPDSDILPLIEQTLDHSAPYDWYSALMDYGSYLKKVTGNPSRQSSHHTVQSKFEGSRRQLRGQIIKQLLANKQGLSLLKIAQLCPDSKKRHLEIVTSLLDEKLISRRKAKFFIA